MGLHEVVHGPWPGGSLALMRWFIGLGQVVHRKTRKPGFFPRSFGPLGRHPTPNESCRRLTGIAGRGKVLVFAPSTVLHSDECRRKAHQFPLQAHGLRVL